MLRRYIRQILEWSHATLVLAVMIPVVYALALNSDNRYTHAVLVDDIYWKCLLVAIPIVLSGVAVKRCKSMAGYTLVCILTLLLTGGLAWFVGPVMTKSAFLQGYVVFIILESFAVVAARYMERLNTITTRRDGDMDFVPRTGFLDKPRMPFMVAFACAYLVGIFFYFPPLADGAFYSAGVYFILCLLHSFMTSTERYFLLNKRVSGVPKKRVYGITGSVLAVFVLTSIAIMFVAIFLSDARQYTDIREWRSDKPLLMIDYESEAKFQVSHQEIDYQKLIMGDTEIKTLPKWVSDVFMAVLGVLFLVVAVQIVKSIKNVFDNFRDAFDENGDEVEDLTELEEKIESLKPKKEEKGMEGYSVRKRYRQMIRRHRKDRPMPYESPAEIEENAGLSEDEEMQKLHVLYEEVRYGTRNGQ
ncbi:MAG: hypothetical protein E7290_12075 [Lachnospiraceae bacterium]|nr:hypothetical protein [Lachnospiraceae bacterium]